MSKHMCLMYYRLFLRLLRRLYNMANKRRFFLSYFFPIKFPPSNNCCAADCSLSLTTTATKHLLRLSARMDTCVCRTFSNVAFIYMLVMQRPQKDTNTAARLT
jgi:hypothetical protein